MVVDAYNNSINEVQEYIESLLLSPKFTKERSFFKGASYILPYPTNKKNEYALMAKNIQKRMEQKGKTIYIINLFDEFISALGDDLDAYLDPEASKKEIKDDFIQFIDDPLIPRLSTMISENDADIYFFVGVGECYPFIKMHIILEKIKNEKERPLIVFYPGKYGKIDGSNALCMFGFIEPENYYRANNIFMEGQYSVN